MPSHTPEPWKTVPSIHGYCLCVQIGTDELYATSDLKPEDARRIVVCVNACAGLSNEQLAGAELLPAGTGARLTALEQATSALIVLYNQPAEAVSPDDFREALFALEATLSGAPRLDVDPSAPCGDCGHPASAHHPELPSPCLAGHDPAAEAEAVASAMQEGRCPIQALRAAIPDSACRCVGWTPTQGYDNPARDDTTGGAR